MTSPHRQNNFDLIRLLAAAQVVIAHVIGHTDLVNHLPGWGKQVFDALMMIPGVPVFFFISGFLIMKSYERNPSDLGGYAWRRALRIYPALWVCFFFTLVALGAFGFLGREFILSGTFISWLAAQVSFVQFFNPEHFRGFGIGVANGALWTITVELQFYVFVPIFYLLTGAGRKKTAVSNAIIGAMFVISFGLFCVMDDQVNGPGGFTGAPILFKLLHVTLIPHLWMFLLGILLHWNFEKLKGWIEGKFLHWIIAYVAFMALVTFLLPERSVPYYLSYLPSRIILAFATLSAAFTWRPLSHRLLGGTDISYGVYIYHSVVINVIVQLGWMTSMLSVAAVFVISIALGLASWYIIEKPAMANKSVTPGALWRRLTRSRTA